MHRTGQSLNACRLQSGFTYEPPLDKVSCRIVVTAARETGPRCEDTPRARERISTPPWPWGAPSRRRPTAICRRRRGPDLHHRVCHLLLGQQARAWKRYCVSRGDGRVPSRRRRGWRASSPPAQRAAQPSSGRKPRTSPGPPASQPAARRRAAPPLWGPRGGLQEAVGLASVAPSVKAMRSPCRR